MPDSNWTPPPAESRESDFSHGLQDLYLYGGTLVRRAFGYEKAWCEFQCGKLVD